MGGEEVFFPPYNEEELRAIVGARIGRAFIESGMSADALDRGIREAAQRWGDDRKTLRLFRQADEAANDRGLEQVTVECLLGNLEGAFPNHLAFEAVEA